MSHLIEDGLLSSAWGPPHTYFSYDPETSGWAYKMVDVDTGSLDSEITSPSGGHWLAWSGSAPLSRDGNLPATKLKLVTKVEFDTIGRETKLTLPNGRVDHKVYDVDMVMEFPAWDSSANEPLLPIQVVETDGAGRTVKSFAAKPSASEGTSIPTGIDDHQSDYVSWTKVSYDSWNGRLTHIDRYHDIPSSGEGTISTNFTRTGYEYDDMGRREYVVHQVSGAPNSSGVEQVTKLEYDIMGRVVRRLQGVSGTSHACGATANDYDYASGEA